VVAIPLAESSGRGIFSSFLLMPDKNALTPFIPDQVLFLLIKRAGIFLNSVINSE
jgi:hypothetical protein